MMDRSSDLGLRSRADAGFPQTHWSVVLAAGGSTTPGAEMALAELCRSYWYPLYAFARRHRQSPSDAQDLTQGFFEHLIKSRLVARAGDGGRRFRSFLLGAFKLYMGSMRARARAQKRGGGLVFLSLDTAAAEARFAREGMDHLSPEVLFDRSWALTVLGEALRRMEAQFKAAGRGAVFEQLSPYLVGDPEAPLYAATARDLGTTEGTIKVTVFRMRRKYRELLRLVVVETLIDPRDVDAELTELRAALRQ